MSLKIGLVDADLLDNGTRHPNLVMMQLAGYLKSHNIKYELLFGNNIDVFSYDSIYMSRVFSFTKEPKYLNGLDEYSKPTVYRGGTGTYAEVSNINDFIRYRNSDMHFFETHDILPGFVPKTQMPDYHLYDKYIEKKINEGANPYRFRDYQFYSIGFLTRGCVRQCEFCVNKLEKLVRKHSELSDFVDPTRPRIYLWDDNILAYKDWRKVFESLIATGKPFQFRQGMDLRLMTEEKAEVITNAKYFGDYIFAFDNWEDRKIIVRKLKIWRKYARKTTKLYLFCGFELTAENDDKLFVDILNLFKRIKILMQFGCLGFVMRHEDYHKHRLNNIYTQIARWCNQPAFFKKITFKQFIDKNQDYAKTDKPCKSVRTYKEFVDALPSKYKDEMLSFFEEMSFENTIDKSLWTQ